MNILFIKYFLVGIMVSEIPRVSVFGYFPLSLIFNLDIYNIINNNIKNNFLFSYAYICYEYITKKSRAIE